MISFLERSGHGIRHGEVGRGEASKELFIPFDRVSAFLTIRRPASQPASERASSTVRQP